MQLCWSLQLPQILEFQRFSQSFVGIMEYSLPLWRLVAFREKDKYFTEMNFLKQKWSSVFPISSKEINDRQVSSESMTIITNECF